jgi:hypothetical protein
LLAAYDGAGEVRAVAAEPHVGPGDVSRQMGGVEVDVLLGQLRSEELGEGPGLHVIGHGPTIAPRPGSRLPYQYRLPRSGYSGWTARACRTRSAVGQCGP